MSKSLQTGTPRPGSSDQSNVMCLISRNERRELEVTCTPRDPNSMMSRTKRNLIAGLCGDSSSKILTCNLHFGIQFLGQQVLVPTFLKFISLKLEQSKSEGWLPARLLAEQQAIVQRWNDFLLMNHITGVQYLQPDKEHAEWRITYLSGEKIRKFFNIERTVFLDVAGHSIFHLLPQKEDLIHVICGLGNLFGRMNDQFFDFSKEQNISILQNEWDLLFKFMTFEDGLIRSRQATRDTAASTTPLSRRPHFPASAITPYAHDLLEHLIPQAVEFKSFHAGNSELFENMHRAHNTMYNCSSKRERERNRQVLLCYLRSKILPQGYKLSAVKCPRCTKTFNSQGYNYRRHIQTKHAQVSLGLYPSEWPTAESFEPCLQSLARTSKIEREHAAAAEAAAAEAKAGDELEDSGSSSDSDD